MPYRGQGARREQARACGSVLALGNVSSPLLKRLAPLFLFERDSRLPDDLRWVKDLHPKNFAQFRLALPLEVQRATRSGDFGAFEDWLADWQIAAEVDADPALRRTLRVRG